MNIMSFAFVDPTMMGATLTLKYGKHFEEDLRPNEFALPGTKAVVLRGPAEASAEAWHADVPQTDTEILAGWPSAKRLLDQAESRIREHLSAPNLHIGRAVIESIAPGNFIGWRIDDSAFAKAHVQFRVLLLASAGVCLYSGGDQLAPGVGNLTYFDNHVLHSVVNLGPVPAVSLVMDVHKPPLQ